MATSMRTQVRAAVVMTLLLSAITGVAYPGLITGVGGALFPRQAKGSLVTVQGRVVGSALIGQSFTSADYFHGRPSNAGAGYDAAASGGRNLGQTSGKLQAAVLADVKRVATANNTGDAPIPVDAVTSSASGLDPHISPAYAALQVPRVAAARALSEERVQAIVAEHTEGRQWGLFGQPRVNVLLLNIALDAAAPRRQAPTDSTSGEESQP
jgi:K+-transporting ATPase ATPase C chain